MKLHEEYCWDVTPYSMVKICRIFKEIYTPYSSLKIVVRLIRYLQIISLHTRTVTNCLTHNL